jgi:hypothetical protein
LQPVALHGSGFVDASAHPGMIGSRWARPRHRPGGGDEDRQHKSRGRHEGQSAMGKWLRENGLADVAAQERYRAMLVLENLAAIETWRDGLDEARRRPASAFTAST